MAREKVLIIKLGYSETLVNDISSTTSLGDVLRSTVLLSHFKGAHITWLVDEAAIPLLKGNKLIDRIMPYDLTTVLQLRAERFDTIVNLEKVAGICALSDSLSGWRRFGFRFDPDTGEAKAYDGTERVLEICQKPEDKIASTKFWEDILFEIVGSEWRGEMPVLGYEPTSQIKYDIGFNHNVGGKWPIKAWPLPYWNELQACLDSKYSITWQEGLDSLEEYIEWINSCELIVTNDSLGLHIAHALGKKIIALFGPTVSNEVYIKNGVKLLPEKEYDCLPCMNNTCIKERPCLYDILPETVYGEIKKILEHK